MAGRYLGYPELLDALYNATASRIDRTDDVKEFHDIFHVGRVLANETLLQAIPDRFPKRVISGARCSITYVRADNSGVFFCDRKPYRGVLFGPKEAKPSRQYIKRHDN